jgi:hypothetical protein
VVECRKNEAQIHTCTMSRMGSNRAISRDEVISTQELQLQHEEKIATLSPSFLPSRSSFEAFSFGACPFAITVIVGAQHDSLAEYSIQAQVVNGARRTRRAVYALCD